LMMAADVGNAQMVESLLAARADPKLRDKKNRTALDWAKAKKRLKVIQILEAQGETNTP